MIWDIRQDMEYSRFTWVEADTEEEAIAKFNAGEGTKCDSFGSVNGTYVSDTPRIRGQRFNTVEEYAQAANEVWPTEPSDWKLNDPRDYELE